MKITNAWLQKHLNRPVQKITHDYDYRHKEQAPRITCVSGASLSVQASTTHYCIPRENVGPYLDVEVGYIEGTLPSWFPGPCEKDIAAYVPIQDVIDYINAEGGVKELYNV